MTTLGHVAWRLVRGSLLGLAGYGLLALAILSAGASVSPLWLPIALVAGVLATRRNDTRSPAMPAPRWLTLTSIVVLASVLGALTYGAMATPARHWDGFVAWDMRARVLADAPTLRQPYFTDHAVFAQSRDYPLLQPLWQASLSHLLGGGGRVLFPVLWLLLVALTGLTARRSGLPPTHAWLAAAGLGLMPMLVSPTSGAVDSGYGENAILLALTAAAAGLLLNDAALLAAACVLAVLLKPEGTVYALAIACTAWWRGDRGLAAGAVLGTVAALSVWLPAREFLELGPAAAANESWALRLLLLVGAAAMAIRLQPRRPIRRILRAKAAWVAVGVGIASAGVLLALGVGSDGGALGGYTANFGRLPARLGRLPALVAALGEQILAVNRFGLLWPILLLATLRRDPTTSDVRTRSLSTMLALGILVICASMVLSPEEDFQHHVRSSLDRLLLQWTGPSVLLAAACLRPEPQIGV